MFSDFLSPEEKSKVHGKDEKNLMVGVIPVEGIFDLIPFSESFPTYDEVHLKFFESESVRFNATE